jgi:hypothetical protein
MNVFILPKPPNIPGLILLGLLVTCEHIRSYCTRKKGT